LPEFTYGEVEKILASLFGADEPVQKTTLRGRIKQFQKLRVPFGLRSGRGKKLAYDQDHIYQWALCLELAEFGLDPSVIVALLKTKWKTMFVPSLQGKDWRMKTPLNENAYFYILPELMSGAVWRERPRLLYPGVLDFDIVPESQLPTWSSLTGDARRISILNLGETVRLIEQQIALLGKDIAPPEPEPEHAKQFEAERRRGEEDARALRAKVKRLREADK
jgi:hypothetical protein